MVSTTKHRVVLVVMLVAVPAAMVSGALTWAGHGLHFSVSEPASLALAGLGLVGLSQALVRRFGKA